MVLKRVRSGDLVAGICGLLLLLVPFLRLWGEYRGDGSVGSVRASLLQGDAFPSLLAWIVVVGGLATALLFVIRTTEGIPEDAYKIYMALGGLMLITLLVLLIKGPNQPERLREFEELRLLVPGIQIAVRRGVMMFIGPLLAAGVAFGGLMMRPRRIQPLGIQMPGRGLDA